MSNALSRAMNECMRTGKTQALTVEEMRQYSEEMTRALAPKLANIRQDDIRGYHEVRKMIVK